MRGKKRPPKKERKRGEEKRKGAKDETRSNGKQKICDETGKTFRIRRYKQEQQEAKQS